MTTPRSGEIVAPDGIVIRPIVGAGSALTSVVVGVYRAARYGLPRSPSLRP